MLDHIQENDEGYVVAWHSKLEHEAGKFQEKVMTWGKARLEAEKLEKKHPENTYWAEHIPKEFNPH